VFFTNREGREKRGKDREREQSGSESEVNKL